MRKRAVPVKIIVGVVLLLALALFIRHAVLKGEEEVVTLRVWEGQKSMLHLPLYVALEEGYFEQQKIRVLLTRDAGTNTGYPEQADAADLVLVDPVVYLYQKSLQPNLPQIVAVIACRDGTFLLGREKGDLAWENLEGKRVIGLPPETGPGLALDKKLREHGLTPYRQVALYNRIPGDLRLGVFKSGTGDYIQLAGLDALTAEQAGTGSIAVPVGDSADIFPAVLCTASEGVTGEHSAALQGFINALYKAMLYMNNEPELGLRAAERHLGKPGRQLTENLFEKYAALGMWEPRPWLDAGVFDAVARAMGEAGQLPAPLSYNDTVDNTFAHRAAETVRYIPPEERDKNWLQRLIS